MFGLFLPTVPLLLLLLSSPPLIRYFPKPTYTPLLFFLPPFPSLTPPFLSQTHKPNNRAQDEQLMSLFTILVFQANFMVSVSFMIRGQHQSSGIIRQRKEEDVVLIVFFLKKKRQKIPSPRWKCSSPSPHTHTHFRPLQTPNPPPLSVSRLSLLLLNGPAPPTCTHNSPVSNSSSSLFVRLSSHWQQSARSDAGWLLDLCFAQHTNTHEP